MMFILCPDFEHDAVCRMYVADIDVLELLNWIFLLPFALWLQDS